MVAPIKTMRFDDSFYNFFGSNLEGVGKEILARPVMKPMMVEILEKPLVQVYWLMILN